ncbi:MAG: DegT/DnrJ/EryC1/StrS family aminotransferase, partial [Thaumarchaeota archaeon]
MQEKSIGFIPINKPIVGDEEKRAVEQVLESGYLTDASYSGGKWVREFEEKLKRLLQVRHVLAVNSGTSALFTSLSALGVKEGDEVILPSFTFVSTANVIIALHAKPVFVDIKEDYNVDPAKIKKAVSRKTKAIIPVHLYGYPADLDEIQEIARSHSAAVVEDAAESIGAAYRGRQTGSTSEFGCFSLYATKVITSGEGGAIATNDDELAERVRLIRNHG